MFLLTLRIPRETAVDILEAALKAGAQLHGLVKIEEPTKGTKTPKAAATKAAAGKPADKPDEADKPRKRRHRIGPPPSRHQLAARGQFISRHGLPTDANQPMIVAAMIREAGRAMSSKELSAMVADLGFRPAGVSSVLYRLHREDNAIRRVSAGVYEPI